MNSTVEKMNRIVMLGGAVLLLLAIVSTQARPESVPLAELPAQSPVPPTSVDSANSSTVAPEEESKVSKFFDDFSTAFKQGTAKVKESFESAATSVKDGVMRGYDYVKDKFSGTGDAVTTPGSSSTTMSDVLTSASPVERKVESSKSSGTNAAAPTATSSTTAKAVRVEPNDEESPDDDRLIFIGDEDVATDIAPNVPSSTTEKTNLDDRFILDGPVACPKGQTAVNGKCRNTF